MTDKRSGTDRECPVAYRTLRHFQLSFNAPARLERPTTMMASGIGEKFIGSCLGEGTLAPAVRSADAKVSRAKPKRRTPWAAVFGYG
jgi:hypothetical protein